MPDAPNVTDAAKDIVDAAKDSPKAADDMLHRILNRLDEQQWKELREAILAEISSLPAKIRAEVKEAMAELHMSPSNPLADQPGLTVIPPQDNPPSVVPEDRAKMEPPQNHGWFHNLMHTKR